MTQRICIIGSGASGLTAIKNIRAEGLEPVCYERTDIFGGLWRFHEEVRPGQSGVMRSTVINTSKEHQCFSDFPFPDDYPNFLHNSKMIEYFNNYVKEFDLEKHIVYHTEVLSLAKAKDYDETGRWVVNSRNVKTKEEKSDVFDGVLVCTGHHAFPRMPTFPGLDQFQGQTMHSHDYKDHRGLEGKKVVIVGTGNSGADIAVELSHIASQVCLVSRRGLWISPKIGKGGMPWDTELTRFNYLIDWLLGEKITNKRREKEVNEFIDHEIFQLKPKHMFIGQHATSNDDLRTRILNGTVKIKPNIKKFTKTDVEFEDGTVEKNVDVVIYATGYVIGFPFIDKEIVQVDDNIVNMYKYVYPPHLKHGTLAVIGLLQIWGALFTAAEIQSRWVARIIKGVSKLPSPDEMWNDINAKKKWMVNRYSATPRHTIECDYIEYMDEIADLIGSKPNMLKLWLTDPRLAYEVYFGPVTPYQYRLHGLKSWPGAREAILTQWDRIHKGVQSRPPVPGVVYRNKSNYTNMVLNFVAVVILAFVVKMIFF